MNDVLELTQSARVVVKRLQVRLDEIEDERKALTDQIKAIEKMLGTLEPLDTPLGTTDTG